VLARLGRGDPATAERVDAYRRRVLKAKPAEPEKPAVETATPAAPEEIPAPPQEERACPPVEVIKAAIPPAPQQSRPAGIAEPPAEQEKPIPKQPEQAPPVQAPPHREQAAVPAEDVCEICGAAVTKSQAKLSQLFMSKTLCKKCMEQP
jgi:hypothetical protein